MKALLIGCSAVAGRRVVPALLATRGIDGIDAASRRGADAARPFAQGGTAYATPDEALSGSDAGLVYISTENAAHVHWAERALAAGRSVIVDKPAFADAATARRLVGMAEAAGLLLAEATVFLDHPRIDALTRAFANDNRPTAVQACFSFPSLPADDFRYDPARGGGALADLGPYAAATCRYFFGDAPARIDTQVLARAAVETAFAVTAFYAYGRCFQGIYGFGSEYQNWISATGPGIAARLDRFCTPPPAAELDIDLRRNNEPAVTTSPAGDCFVAFFARAADAMTSGETARFHADLLADADFRDRMREGAR